MSYIVYMHENKENHKKYIGITKQSLKKRSRKGEGYKGCSKFYSAIQKYGWNNFKHIILFRGLTKEEAEQKEIELIKEYNTQIDGYNIANGGSASVMTEETKEKLSRANSNNNRSIAFNLPSGKTIIFKDIKEAVERTKLDKKYIKDCCDGVIKSPKGGFRYYL